MIDGLRKWLAGWRGIGLLGVAVAIIWLAGQGLPDGRLHVFFLDVGQGDAIFIRTPDGRQVLIDGGPSPAALLAALGDVMPFWDRRLDLVVLTHPDQDHSAGLLPLAGRYRIGQILTTTEAAAEPGIAAWLAQAAQAGSGETQAQLGQQILLGGPVLTVLYAAVGPAGDGKAGDNNHSLVLRLDYGAISFLFTGDAEQDAEAAMLGAGTLTAATVLKVAHHGSDRSTSARFLAAVAPRLAVIQVGAGNRFGHPAAATLERLAGIPVVRTDRDGQIETISDGEHLWVERSR